MEELLKKLGLSKYTSGVYDEDGCYVVDFMNGYAECANVMLILESLPESIIEKEDHQGDPLSEHLISIHYFTKNMDSGDYMISLVGNLDSDTGTMTIKKIDEDER